MKYLPRLCLVLLPIMVAPLLSADAFSFSGSISTDDKVLVFNFTLASTQTVIVRTLSYGGGTNDMGVSFPGGGFDSALWVFGSDGSIIGSNDDDTGSFGASGLTCDHVTPGPAGCLDSWFSDVFDPGTYSVALVVSGNSPTGGPSDPFAEDGNPNFTCAGWIPTDNFCLSSFPGTPLSGQWALDIENVTAAAEAGAPAVPEPHTWILAGVGILMLGMVRAGGWNRRLNTAGWLRGFNRSKE